MRGATNNPQLVVMNNTAAPQQVTLLSPSPNALGSLNAKTKYNWDLSTETFVGVTMVMIQVRSVSGPSVFQTLTAVCAPTIAGVVAALNGLKISSFYQEGTFIRSSNDYFIFGLLELNNTKNLWKVNGFVKVNSLSINNQMGYFFSNLTTAVSLSSGAIGPPVVPPQNLPINDNILFPVAQLKNGDIIQLIVLASAVIATPVSFVTVLKQNGITIINNTQVATGVVIFTFPYLENAQYTLNATIN